MDLFEIKVFVSFLQDLLTIEKDVQVKFAEIDTPAKFIVDNEGLKILLDESKLKDSITIRDVLVHEMRHCYQYLVINDKEYEKLEEPSTIKKWKKSFRSYRTFAGCDYSEEIHSSQTIELDAICFAQLVIGTIYPNVRINEFRANDVRFKQRLLELSNDFTKEEIEECMFVYGIKRERILS